MQRKQETDPDQPKSRPTSRRNSASSRRSSIKEVKDKSPPNSVHSTPKKFVKPLDFMVTGRQILKKSDRANSLPGTYRRPLEDTTVKISPRRDVSHATRSQDTLEDDFSLDLSQVSDFEDTNSKYGLKHTFKALATSTPKSQRTMLKHRSGSVQSHIVSHKVDNRRNLKSLDGSKQDSCSFSRDSLYKTSSSASYRYGTDLDYSSVSPEYSGLSSADLSPRDPITEMMTSPMSQDLQMSSSCVSNFQDCSEITNTEADGKKRHETGEWTDFWANYNNSLSKVPMKSYYDQCPTPFRTENIADFDISTDNLRKRSPENIRNLNNIICNEGLHLTPKETQNIIKCAHLLNNVLSKAIERRSSEETKIHQKTEIQTEVEEKKRSMTLNLKETVIPLEVKEERRCETVTTQTDISLPNTRSAPIIFENILRQLSKSSIDEGVEVKVEENDKSKSNLSKE